MPFKAIMWDMDGTLIDSEVLYEKSVHKVNLKHNLKIHDSVGELRGVSLIDAWENYIIGDSKQNLSYDKWKNDIQANVDDRADHLEIFEFAQEVLRTAHTSNILQTCVSNNSKYFIEDVLKRNNIDHVFAHWIGYEDVNHCKPHPEPYLLSAQKIDVDPADCLVIEDSVVGALSAKAAGMRVAVFNPQGQFSIKAEIDYPIRCHSELLKVIAA